MFVPLIAGACLLRWSALGQPAHPMLPPIASLVSWKTGRVLFSGKSGSDQTLRTKLPF